jgi:hypothetical protein
MFVDYAVKWSVSLLNIHAAAFECPAHDVDRPFWRIVSSRAHSDR